MEAYLQQYNTMAFSTQRATPEYIERIISLEQSSVRVLLTPILLADGGSSAFLFDRGSFSVSVVATISFISQGLVDMAFITAPFSNTDFYNCSFSDF